MNTGELSHISSAEVVELQPPGPVVYVWPNVGEEPRVVPLSLAIDAGITVAAGRFDDIDELDVLTPEQGGNAKTAHQLLLLLLDNTSIEYSDLAKELDYKSEEDVERSVDEARRVVNADSSLRNRFDISQVRYKRALDSWLAVEHPVIEQPAGEALAVEPSQEQQLLELVREGDGDAIAVLEQRYEPLLTRIIDELGNNIPDSIIDFAWGVLYSSAKHTVTSPFSNFEEALETELRTAIAGFLKLHGVAEQTRNLDVPEYYHEIRDFERELGKNRLKSSLDAATINTVVEGAINYMIGRFREATKEPVPGYWTIRTPMRSHLLDRIKNSYAQTMTRLLKASSIMADRGIKDFHVAQLPPELLERFEGIVLDEVAQEQIQRTKSKLKR